MQVGSIPVHPGVFGQVAERAWGATLASFAIERRTGELVVHAHDGKRYRIAFLNGAVVAASSPVTSDSVARIALTSHLVSSSQIPAIAQRLATVAGRDEIDVVAEAARLSVQQAVSLRRRVITQRAARTFSIDRGELAFERDLTLSVIPGIEIELGAAIYLGVRMYLSEPRLAQDLRTLGERFVLRSDADHTRFGFTVLEQPILESLRTMTSLAELDARHRDVEPRIAQAIVYALVSCGACEVIAPEDRGIVELQTRTPTTTWPKPRVPTARTSAEPAAAVSRTRTQSASPAISRTVTARRDAFAVRQTILAGLALLEGGADHFALLGVAPGSSLDVIRSAYVAFASQLHPSKLPQVDALTTADAQRLFGAINLAFGVLNDPVRRAEYTTRLHTPKAARPAASPAATAATQAEAAFHRGVLALRREDLEHAIGELSHATELAPEDVDYHAMLAWARFCAAHDKQEIASETRKVLDKAVRKSPKPMMARFYLGRVERMLGRLREALFHFREVLDLEPGHTDAATEVRLLEQRVAANARHSRR